MGSTTISKYSGIPKVLGSTGVKNGHECLYPLSCYKILKQGLTAYLISSLLAFLFILAICLGIYLILFDKVCS